MSSNIDVFWGAEPEVRSEKEFLTQLKADLESRNVTATILANFYTNHSSRQVDFLVITDNHVCQVELKSYSGVLIGTTNGPWSTRRPDGALETIDRQNPYDQAVSCKFAVSDDMQAVADQDSSIPRPPKGKRFYTQIDSVILYLSPPRTRIAGSQRLQSPNAWLCPVPTIFDRPRQASGLDDRALGSLYTDARPDQRSRTE